MSAAPAPLTDAFRALLEHAETLELNEGDMLRVNNALQTAFNQTDGKIIIKKSYTPLFVYFLRGGKQVGVKLVENVQTIFTGTRIYEHKTKTTIDISENWKDAEPVVSRQTFPMAIATIIPFFLKQHKPKKVYIESVFGTTRHSWANFVLEMRAKLKQLRDDLKSAGRSNEDAIEMTEEYEQTHIHEFYDTCGGIAHNAILTT